MSEEETNQKDNETIDETVVESPPDGANDEPNVSEIVSRMKSKRKREPTKKEQLEERVQQLEMWMGQLNQFLQEMYVNINGMEEIILKDLHWNEDMDADDIDEFLAKDLEEDFIEEFEANPEFQEEETVDSDGE